MTPGRVLRWWAPTGIVAMIALGLLVGAGSTRLDDRFIGAGDAHRGFGRLLLFTEPVLLGLLLLAAVAVGLWRRRWRLAVLAVLTPAVAVAAVRLLKPLFGRQRGGALAYPSGHVTVMVTVLGVVLLVAGMRVWTLIAAAVYALLGIVGQAMTYHYFTDTVGAALLGTALVCAAACAAGLDRCQPPCDLHHSDG
jgi:membrane-associated phospholipid phosphatase